MTKRKEARRELLKHDEFLTKMERAARFIQTNPSKISMWVALVVLVLAGVAGGINYYQNNMDKAASGLYLAEKSFLRTLDDPDSETKFETEKEKNEASLKELEAYTSQSSGKNRLQALFYKASCEMELGLVDQAQETYTEISKDSGEYGIMGLICLGDLNMGKDDFAKALENYKEIDNKSGKPLFEDIVKYRIAKAYQKSGDLKSAEMELESLVQKYETLENTQKPPVHQDALDLLEEIKTKNEAS